MAFSHLIGAFSVIVTQFQQFSSYAVVLARLGALGEAVEQLDGSSASRMEIDESAPEIGYQHLTLRSADGAVLVDDLSATLRPGARTLVSGPGDAPRIALFRATAGLWYAGEGRILRPPSDEVLYLTERPYLPPGTLRDVLLRTGREAQIGDARIAEVLGMLGVGDLPQRVGGLDVERDWDEQLSLAEQQLLSVARLVLAAPRFALLDRPGSVLSDEAVARVLDVLASASITTVAFAARAPAGSDPDARLELASDGSWSWHAASQKSAHS
jgi:putative ATP-binding cassette transporter